MTLKRPMVGHVVVVPTVLEVDTAAMVTAVGARVPAGEQWPEHWTVNVRTFADGPVSADEWRQDVRLFESRDRAVSSGLQGAWWGDPYVELPEEPPGVAARPAPAKRAK
jgi:hypothetical protein